MKKARQQRILEIISQTDVHTQEGITEQLIRDGFKVTQATVSRDLRDLHLIKETDNDGRCHYVVSAESDKKDENFAATMFALIEDIRISGNIVVLKTPTGFAQGVASAVDAIKNDDIIGSVAGDDNIILVTLGEKESIRVMDAIRAIAPREKKK